MSLLSLLSITTKPAALSSYKKRHIYSSERILIDRRRRENDQIFAMRREGESILSIARKMERSQWYVQSILEGGSKEQALEKTLQIPKNDEQAYKKILEMRKKGISLRRIGPHFGRSYGWAFNIVKRIEKLANLEIKKGEGT